MGFSNAYGIEKNIYNANRGIKVLNPEFKKYQVVKMACTFGYIPIVEHDVLYLTRLDHVITVGDGSYPDSQFIIDINNIKARYNKMLNAAGEKDINKYYPPIDQTLKSTEEMASPEADDSVMYAARLLESIDKSKLDDVSSNDLRNLINASMEDAIDALENQTTWGKDIAESVKYFWTNNGYMINRQTTEALGGGPHALGE